MGAPLEALMRGILSGREARELKTFTYEPGIVDRGPDPWAFVLAAALLSVGAGLGYAIVEPGPPVGLGTFFSLLGLTLGLISDLMRRRSG